MSLINQMLRDLQQRKKEDASQKAPPPSPGKLERIPYLPMPLVLGGVGVLLLCLIWWTAGVLSDLMFSFEPVQKTAPQQVAVADDAAKMEKLQPVAVEEDVLTLAERIAEPGAAVLAARSLAEDQPVRREEKPAPITPPVQKVSPKPELPRKVVAVETSSGPVAVQRKPVPAPVRAIKPVSKKAIPLPVPRKVAAKAPERIHPDDLPGAIRTSSRTGAEPKIVVRPSRAPATTPYGMADEAYLDGQWAYERERSNLAKRSLQEALKLYPGHLPAREMLVNVLSKEGKNGEAMFLLAEGLEIAPDYMPFKKRYARLLMDQGDYDAAIKVMLNGGLPVVEDDPEAHVVLASLYQRLDESFLAAQTYRNLLVTWPQTGAFWVGLGGALEGQRLPEEAIECYRKALKTEGLRKDLSAFAEKRLKVLN